MHDARCRDRRFSLNLVPCIVNLVLAGCSAFAPPISSEEVVRHDPEFAALLQDRSNISAEVQQLETGLQAERHALLQEIHDRRAALRAREDAIEAQIRVLEQRLDPARVLVRAKLSQAEAGLSRAAATLKSLRRTRTELARVVDQARDRETADVRQWREQLAALDAQIPPLETQQTTLRRQRQLYQAQLRLLSR